MSTVKAVLNKDRKKKCGGYSLVVQVIHKRAHRCIYTPYAFTDEEFDAKAQTVIYTEGMRFTRKEVAEINRYAAELKENLERIITKLTIFRKEFHVQDVIYEYFQGKSNRYLTIFTERLIEKRVNSGKMGQAKAFRSTLKSLEKFLGERIVMFDDITPLLVQEYQTFLLDRELEENSVSFYLRNFRVIYNTALNSGVEMEDNHPFGKMRIRHGRTVKRALPKEVIEQIADFDLSDSPEQERARDLFMFSFCARGMSFVDVIHLKKSDIVEGIIYYQRQKTHRRMQVTITPQLQQLIDKYPAGGEYLFPFLNVNDPLDLYQRYLIAYGEAYRHLQKVRKRIGLSTSLTIHVARHSWATIAKLEGAPIETIRQALGHDSEKTTEIYLKELDNSVVDAWNEKVVYFQPGKRALKGKKRAIFAANS